MITVPEAVGIAEILLVEDSPSDSGLTIRALQKGRLRNNVSHVTEAEEALRFLRREGEFASRPRPDLILLDLNLPGMNGHDLLQRIKNDTDLMAIPVVVMSSSQRAHDIDEAYRNRANCYVSKPVDAGKFVESVRAIEEFWLMVAKRPRK